MSAHVSYATMLAAVTPRPIAREPCGRIRASVPKRAPLRSTAIRLEKARAPNFRSRALAEDAPESNIVPSPSDAPTRSDTESTSDRPNRRASSSSNRDPRPAFATQIVRATKVN